MTRQDSRASTPTAGHAPAVVVFGAAPDTSNLGVSALCRSLVCGVASREPGASVTVFDHGRGVREARVRGGECDGFVYGLCGAANTRRLHRREAFWNMRVSGWLGGAGNPGVRAIREANAALDISGGDSFTDLYGPQRFATVSLPKLIALEQGTDLILAPQTYGPFRSDRAREAASRIVRRARMAWARDDASFEVLRDLLGDAFDPDRHRVGVDVAFGLEAIRPDGGAVAGVESFVEGGRAPIGFNVSGLLYNDPNAATERYGLRADYRELVRGFLTRLLERTDERVLLVPHVLAADGHVESDVDAAGRALEALGGVAGGRVMVAPTPADASGAKWLISMCSWFCGMRMHSTIAALSSGVTASAIAYSPKTRGVFETCDVGDAVVDPRVMDTGEALDALWAAWEQRDEHGRRLRAALPGVLTTAREQMDAIVEAAGGVAAARAGAA